MLGAFFFAIGCWVLLFLVFLGGIGGVSYNHRFALL